MGFDKYERCGAYHWRGFPDLWRVRGFSPRAAALYRIVWKEIERRGSGPRVLDVGCGDGVFVGLSQRLSPVWGTCAVGIDWERKGLELAQQELVRRGQRSLLVQGDGACLPFAAGTFDAAVSIETIEHMEDPRSLVAEMARVVRADGYLVLTTPARRGDGVLYDARHVREFNREELAEVVGERTEILMIYGLIGHERYEQYGRSDVLGRVGRYWWKLIGKSSWNPFLRRLRPDAQSARHLVCVARVSSN